MIPPAETLALVALLVFVGGLVKGIAGFGYAIASTAFLATVLDPGTAVVVMILPMLAANLSLVRELDRDSFSACLRRFWPYVAAAVGGTLLGMALLSRVPTPVVALGLGLFTGGYVAVKQPYVALPGEDRLRAYCFRPSTTGKLALGFVSGVVFGAANVAVQVVAYLDSLALDRETFVGVLAMILVGVSTVRVAAAWQLGLYEAAALPLSVGAVVPGLLGVSLGGVLREYIPERAQTAGTLLLLGVIAVRLSVTGATGL
ncbi:sulfite exporter TauE/SafE family protein [Natronomonas sp. EA1]|uniref:sulfite exporter TauE/SafE family protein n=1 Tax=Natronomonas sp. EA1 TaxID=3421655 RepID=UPI003EB8A513